MKFIYNLIKQNAILILHVFCTCILCVLFALFFERFPDYLLFGNIIFCLLGIYYIYKILFKKIYSDSFLKIICILSILISINKLYSYDKLTSVLPSLSNINQNWITVSLMIIATILLVVFKLFSYVEKENNYNLGNPTSTISKENTATNNANNTSIPHNTPNVNMNNKKELYSFLRFLGLFVLLSFLIAIPVILLYFFNKNGLSGNSLEFDKVLSFFLSYGASFLLILFAIIIVIISLIYIIRYIYTLVYSFNDKSKGEKIIPTYAFSVIVVCVLLFLAWRLSDFSLNDLTETLVVGDYLAFPIAAIVAIILFFLLVQIVHAILLMLSRMTADNITKFIKEQNNRLELSKQIKEIIDNIINIILQTILATLKFIKFVPDFFTSLCDIVLLEDEVENDEFDVP